MGQSEHVKVLLSAESAELVEKKSRFIAHLKCCETEEEATAFIEEIKKKYWDARHNCSAFVLGTKAELTRCSDDGEPAGTAGRPMLETLLGSGVRNVCVVVTRYFGGVLLGTGGLVRAYTQAVKLALEASEIGCQVHGEELEVVTDYNGIGKILYMLGKWEIEPLSADYGENVVLKLQIPSEKVERFTKEIIEVTNAKARITKLRELDFIDKNYTEE